MKEQYQPPFKITSRMLNLVANISELLGRWSVSNDAMLSPKLRRGNRLQTIQASLAIENNTLSLKQVTAVIEGKNVLGLPREIQEVRNAFATYEEMDSWKPSSKKDLLAAHDLLMKGLVDLPGCFRNTGVGIYHGKQLVHMAPPASRVPMLIKDLLTWLSKTDVHPLIASCVFHYEFEFIHPFADGNGRLGRLWQTLILSHWQPMFAYLPVETVIFSRQREYYKALSASDKAADSTVFVEFILEALFGALEEAIEKSSGKSSVKSSGKTEDRILDLLKINPEMTIPDLAMTLKLSTRAIEKQLDKLKTQNRLKRIGPAKGGRWEVQ